MPGLNPIRQKVAWFALPARVIHVFHTSRQCRFEVSAQKKCARAAVRFFLSAARLLLRHNCNKGIIVARRMGNLALDGVLAAVYVACSIYFNARAMLPFRA